MTRQRLKLMVLGGGGLLTAAVLLAFPEAVAGGISRGLSICGGVIIPSLFPFLVLGGVLTRSGVAAAVGRRLEGVTRGVFGLSGCCATGLLLGAVGGYPAGGAVVGELVRSGRITREEGRRMLRSCVNGGPAFFVSAVGVGLFGSRTLGWILCAANAVAALILGITARGSRRTSSATVPRRTVSVSDALVESVTASCETVLYMCGFVVLFSAVIAVIEVSGILDVAAGENVQGQRLLSAMLACVLEVSCGCTAASSLGEPAVPLVGFAVGFGGLSVHCQLAAALRGLRLLDSRFFLARVAQGGMTALLATVVWRYIPRSVAVWGTMQQPVAEASYGSALLSAAVLLLGGIWMLTVGRRRCD